MRPLNPQAILDGHSSNRTPVPLIIGLLVGGLCILLALAYYLLAGGVVGTLVGMALALPTAIVLVALILFIDRLEPEPRLYLVLAFVWGGGVAIIGSLIINSTGGAVLTGVVGAGLGDYLTAALIAPVVEESFKGTLLLLMLLFRRNEIDGPIDGIVYASLSALGFALVENVLYYLRGWYGDDGSLAVMIVVRGVVAPLGHPLYTSMIGLGVAYAATHRGPGRFFAVIGGWIVAVLLHGLWNASTIFGYLGLGIVYLLLVGVLITTIAIIIRDRRKTVRMIQTHLAAYLPSGLVSPQDLQMLGTMSGRRQARHWARSNAGMSGVRAMGDYQLAATELALLHGRAANRAIEPDQFHRRRDAIVGLMRAARDAFFRRVPQAAPPPWVGAGRAESSGFFAPPAQSQPLPTYQQLHPVTPPGGQPQRPGFPPPHPGQPRPPMPPQQRPQGRPAAPGAPHPGPPQPGPPQRPGFPPGNPGPPQPPR